uniref:Uncharacterized protein n=1 Tax=Caenorhabditis japonica TaxID=281687 RepID=A0A8R1IFP7_CAEJA
MAKTSSERPRSLLTSLKSNYRPEVIYKLGDYHSMRRIIDSVRNRENTDRKDVDLGKGVTGQYRLTNNGDQFLMTEITVNNKPLIMFASYRNLQLLSSSNIILVDGTFDVVPNGFTQLYTIHGYVSEMKPN